MMIPRTAILALAVLAFAATLGCDDDGPLRPRPRQSRIVYTRIAGLWSQIWVMNGDGAYKVPLTNDTLHTGYPSLSRNGAVIHFTRWRLIGGTQVRSYLCRMNANGSNPVYLDSVPDTYYGNPRLSPDGTKIVYSINGDVWTVNADGSTPVNLTSGTGGGTTADWSPDGTRLIYSRVTGAGYRIYSMKADGTDTLKIFEPGIHSNQTQPRWSPDGSRVVYTDDHGNQAGMQYTWIDAVNTDGTSPTSVTPSVVDGHRSEPCWSPDGQRIAYRDDVYPAEIVSVKPDGTDPINLTHDATSYDFTPDWGPPAP